MRIVRHRITIVSSRKPNPKPNLNDELQFFGESLGLFNLRDKDKSCFRLFIELLKSSKLNHPLTSDELAYRLKLSRGTVVHHINKLMQSGIVIHEGNNYLLRVSSLEALMEEIQGDIDRTITRLKHVAKEIDGALGL